MGYILPFIPFNGAVQSCTFYSYFQCTKCYFFMTAHCKKLFIIISNISKMKPENNFLTSLNQHLHGEIKFNLVVIYSTVCDGINRSSARYLKKNSLIIWSEIHSICSLNLPPNTSGLHNKELKFIAVIYAVHTNNIYTGMRLFIHRCEEII